MVGPKGHPHALPFVVYFPRPAWGRRTMSPSASFTTGQLALWASVDLLTRFAMLPGKAMIVVVSQTPYMTLVDFAKEQMARRQNSPTPSTSTALFDRSWPTVIIAC
jgi:hypothetical protein